MSSPGVVNPATDFVVTPASGLNVSISSGYAFVQQTIQLEGSSSYNGFYGVLNDGATSPFNTITAPVTNPRIDQVILRVYDVNEQGLGGSSKGQIEWLAGSETASASITPGDPGYLAGVASLPANSLRLAYVLNTVGASSIPSGNILLSHDVGWIPLSLNSNIISGEISGIPSLRLRGGTVYLRGTLFASTTVSVAAVLATIPTSYRPITGPLLNTNVVRSSDQSVVSSVAVCQAGAPTGIATDVALASGDQIPLNGCSYELI